MEVLRKNVLVLKIENAMIMEVTRISHVSNLKRRAVLRTVRKCGRVFPTFHNRGRNANLPQRSRDRPNSCPEKVFLVLQGVRKIFVGY